MVTRTFCGDCEVDVDIETSDVIEFLNRCSDEEYSTIMSSINRLSIPGVNKWSVEDDLKHELWTGTLRNFNLAELEEMIGKHPSSRPAA